MSNTANKGVTMVYLSTTQTAEELNSALGLTNVTAEKVRALVHTGALKDQGTGRSVKIAFSDIQRFAGRIRVETPSAWPTTSPLFRVSVIHLRDDVIPDDSGRVLRTHAGVDYSGTSQLSQQMQDLAWTGVWQASDETVQTAIDHQALLVATTKGYINPSYIRTITGARRTPDGKRIWWETAPAPSVITTFVGTGLWMQLETVRESDWWV
jgi:hypothetical protein